MRVLYAIQGTGNGHISRAKEVIPVLINRVNLDVMISGIQADLDLPFPVKYRSKGMSFIFGKNGGINIWATLKNCKIARIIKEVNACPVEDYDLVINDFEPISAWACRLKGVWCISLSHQSAFRSALVPKPVKKDLLGSLVLKYYAPCNEYFSFHFESYDRNIYKPVIRNEIRKQEVYNHGYYCVYLPSFSDEKLIKKLSNIKDVEWQVFSKHIDKAYSKENVHIFPIRDEKFCESMAGAAGVLCGAGFETPAEALYLHKKLMVIPMKNQYEQLFNAESLAELGVPVISNLKKKNLSKIKNWVKSDEVINVFFPDQTQFIVDRLLQEFIANRMLKEYIVSFERGYEK